MFHKQFKDPIYDYIEIDNNIVAEIIDTPVFQRLKDIRQTSYMPLFPAAYHNRYVHSLGVYHLGKIAFRAIKPQLLEYSVGTNLETRIDTIQNIFELACLLHDVGHAPFSHTGEAFFLDEEDTLYNSLKECVEEDGFKNDFSALGTKKPAPHECMSCVVGLKSFPKYFFLVEDRNLFARCIIGMPYQFNEKEPKSFSKKMNEGQRKELKNARKAYFVKKKEIELLNCIISLLNSSIIDVDRLDYIIRDSITIGFKSAQVDYMRLLSGMRIVENQSRLCIGYHKSALSVIESAIYAHDAEKKWVQSHPSILYEMEALKNAMSILTASFSTESDQNPIFCYESLTESGKTIVNYIPLLSQKGEELSENNNLWSLDANVLLEKKELFSDVIEVNKGNLYIVKKIPISLLADEDFLHLMKRFCKSGLGYEYFARNKRRTAVWKSEAEFRALFQEYIGDDTRSIKKLEANLEGLVDFCQDQTGVPIVNRKIFDLLEMEEAEAIRARDKEEIDQDYYDDIMQGVREKKHWVEVLENVVQELNDVIEFEFLIIFQKKFNSSFKSSIGDIPILFPNVEDGVIAFSKVVDVLHSNAERKSNFFHLYYKPRRVLNKEEKKDIVNSIAKALRAGTNM